MACPSACAALPLSSFVSAAPSGPTHTFTYNGWFAVSPSLPLTGNGTTPAVPPTGFAIGNTYTPSTVFNPCVATTPVTSGYYVFTSSLTASNCTSTTQFAIPVVPSIYAGENTTVSTCANGTCINLWNVLDAASPNPVTLNTSTTNSQGWVLSGASTPAFSVGNGNTTATFCPSLISPVPTSAQTYTLTYKVCPTLPAGYTGQAGCANCDCDEATVTITVNPLPSAGTQNLIYICSTP